MKGAKSKSGAKLADSKLSVRARKKVAKDPNKPKRPASAFFVFLEDFRKTFKEKNPNNKSIAAVGKAAGVEWKSMSEADKAPYVEKAEKRKAEYEKSMKAYANKQVVEEDSDKSKSEVSDNAEEHSAEAAADSGEEDD